MEQLATRTWSIRRHSYEKACQLASAWRHEMTDQPMGQCPPPSDEAVKWAKLVRCALLAQLDVQIGDSFEADIAKGTLTLRPAKPKALQSGDAAIEAMKYALKADEGMEFQRCWMHGDFDAIVPCQ